jgi:hypothetical protein
MQLSDRQITKIRISLLPYPSGSLMVWQTVYFGQETGYHQPVSDRLTTQVPVEHLVSPHQLLEAGVAALLQR